jgi:hypothetical protein
VLQRQEFELAEERRRAVEGNVAARSAAERLAEAVDELKTFEVALDTVSAKGFLSRRLEQLLAREELDHWARRTPRSPIPDKEAFSLQEQLYDPDLNDGVRVNVAPLQKSGLLAADVLAIKMYSVPLRTALNGERRSAAGVARAAAQTGVVATQ